MQGARNTITNPLIAEVTRGGIVESVHRGAFCVSDASGAIIAAAGDIARPVFPRSAIKALQALTMVEVGVAKRFGFTDAEIALSCASHGGESVHVAAARSMLAKVGLDETAYECGPHWPTNEAAAHTLARTCKAPLSVHNNCSGKHAGMLGLAQHLGVPVTGYVDPQHPVQQAIAAVIGEMCEVDIPAASCGFDGCSVPTWAIPLENLARGFARFGSGNGLGGARATATRQIISAVRAEPFMVAGTGRFCTRVMQSVPQVFVKTGAEGVFCGTVPETGIGIALKCDDGATRAAECLMAHLLAAYGGLDEAAADAIRPLSQAAIYNRAGIETGHVRVAF